MSLIFTIALFGVYALIGAALVEALFSVSRRPPWRRGVLADLEASSAERRVQVLAFVGKERRSAGDADESRAEELAIDAHPVQAPVAARAA